MIKKLDFSGNGCEVYTDGTVHEGRFIARNATIEVRANFVWGELLASLVKFGGQNKKNPLSFLPGDGGVWHPFPPS